jgi:hypothetical protein
VPVSVLIAVGLVVFARYMVFGVTAFGASPIAIPVLVHVLPLMFALSLAAILDLSSALALGFHTRRQAGARELVALVPFTLVIKLSVSSPWHRAHRRRGWFEAWASGGKSLGRRPPRQAPALATGPLDPRGLDHP